MSSTHSERPAPPFRRTRFVGGLALLLALLVGCAAPSSSLDPDPELVAGQIAQERVAPPYYRVGGGAGATLLVLGTIHLGPPGGWRLSSEIERGLQQADAFVLEIDLRESTEEEVSTVLAERVVLPVSVTLEDVVSPETAKLLAENEDTLARLGFPALARKRLKPWFLAVALTESTNRLSGFEAGQSVENSILAAIGDRPLVGLETFEEQLALFDALSPRLQDIILRDTVSRLDESAAEFASLVRAWARSDEPTLVEIAYQGVEEMPELSEFYEILLEGRNRRWVEELAPMLEDPDLAGNTLFVGVGALHLVGPGSLIRALEAKGFEIEEQSTRTSP